MSTLRALTIGFALIGLTTVGACAYPNETVVQGGNSAAIYFEGFPGAALVTVDGTIVGTASDFDGSETTLGVKAGPHSVVITDGSSVLYDKKVYVDRDSALSISR